MGSFWIVKNSKPIEHVGRPRQAGNTSFAFGCSDETYLAAGLYRHIDWAGTVDPRTQQMSAPRFIVDEAAKAVHVEYDITAKTPDQIAAYDAEQAGLQAEAAAEAARIAAKAQAVADSLPSWAVVEAAIEGADTLAKLRAIILKLARVVYWDIKNTGI